MDTISVVSSRMRLMPVAQRALGSTAAVCISLLAVVCIEKKIRTLRGASRLSAGSVAPHTEDKLERDKVESSMKDTLEFYDALLCEMMHTHSVSEIEQCGSFPELIRGIILGETPYQVPVDTIISELTTMNWRRFRGCMKNCDANVRTLFLSARSKLALIAFAYRVFLVEQAVRGISMNFRDNLEEISPDSECAMLLRECVDDMIHFEVDWADLGEAEKLVFKRLKCVQATSRDRTRESYRALAVYLCMSSPFKILCVGSSIGLAGLTSCLALQGNFLRREVENHLSSIRHQTPDVQRAELCLASVLIAGEVIRLACTVMLEKMQQNFISISTSFHRERVKMKLYLALPYLPLAFFDRFTSDDVEEMILFVNDLEGVDVHLQTYAVNLIRSAVDLATKFHSLNRSFSNGPSIFSFLVVAAITCRGVEWALKRFTSLIKRAQSGRFSTIADTEELENVVAEGSRSDACGGVFLRGLACLSHVHTLRPFRAELKLLEGWVGRLNALIDRRDMGYAGRRSSEHSVRADHSPWVFCKSLCAALFDRILSRLVRESIDWLPALASSVSKMAQILLPLVTYVALQDATIREGGATATPLFVGETISAIERMLTLIGDRVRIVELLHLNADKALTLERLFKSAASAKEAEDQSKETVSRILAHLRQSPFSSIVVRDLTFSYPSKPSRAVLKNVSVKIPVKPGSLVVITGASGCGKSTLLNLLLRLYDPQSGQILLASDNDEIDITKFPFALAQSIFSFVPQHPVIYPGTVAQNISLEAVVSIRDVAVLDKVRKAAALAQCSTFVESLPERYMTVVGQGADASVKLSGGQAQRIGIARALFRSDCSLLLLDEPTSALDPITKESLIATLRGLLEGVKGDHALKCVICITHDERLIEAADVVVSLHSNNDT